MWATLLKRAEESCLDECEKGRGVAAGAVLGVPAVPMPRGRVRRLSEPRNLVLARSSPPSLRLHGVENIRSRSRPLRAMIGQNDGLCLALPGAFESRRRAQIQRRLGGGLFENVVGRSIGGRPPASMTRVVGFPSILHLPPTDKNSRRNTRRAATISWSGAS